MAYERINKVKNIHKCLLVNKNTANYLHTYSYYCKALISYYKVSGVIEDIISTCLKYF